MKKKFEMSDLIPIVADLADKYTSKESSSIPYHIARQLMNAVIYCIQEQERSELPFPSHEIVSNDKEILAKQAYDGGYQLVLKKVQLTKVLYEEIIDDFHDYRNLAYHDTIIAGMPEFFRYYDAKFFPQNHLLTLDYPTIVGIGNRCGIDAIYQYLSYIQLEQLFLKKIPETYLLKVLSTVYGNYEELFINISSVALKHVLGCMMAGKKMTDVHFSRQEYENIEGFLRGRQREETEQKLLEYLQIFIQQGYENNQSLLSYLSADIRDFSFELSNAMKHGTLYAIFGD